MNRTANSSSGQLSSRIRTEGRRRLALRGSALRFPSISARCQPETSEDRTTLTHSAGSLIRGSLPGCAVLGAAVLLLPGDAWAVLQASATEAIDSLDFSVVVDKLTTGVAAGHNAFLYGAAYVLATVLFLPASPLTIGAGAVFGPLEGTIIVSLASNIGAAIAFLISRFGARPFVRAKLESNKRFRAIDVAIGEEGVKIVALLRLSPLVPFSLLNYMLGLTCVDFGEYVLCSWIAMLPSTFAYVSLGAAGRSAYDSLNAGTLLGDPVRLTLLVLACVSTLLATNVIAGIASKALAVEDDDLARTVDDDDNGRHGMR